MTRVPLSGSLRQCRLLVLGFLAFSACTDSAPPSAPLSSGIGIAKSASSSGPTVRATDPDSATVDTTLNVRVLGGGFDAGSRANWAIKGVVSDKIVTNSTRFVSSTELVANITIARTAILGRYDVMVTTSSGKGGIGTELFVVTAKATDLGTLGGVASEALGVNNFTQVVGWSNLASGAQRAFLWTKQGGMRDLGTLGGNSSKAYAINDNGQVVGSSLTASGELHAFLWTATDQMRDLGTLGVVRTEAFAISQNSAIVGASFINGGSESPVYWSAGVIENLGGIRTRAVAVNNGLQVVGWDGGTDASTVKAMLWTKSGGVWTSEVLVAPNQSDVQANGINELGQVAGGFRAPSGSLRGFFWTRAGGSKELPLIPNGASAWAYAINNAGRIGGWANSRSGAQQATIWDPTPGGWTVRVLGGPSKAGDSRVSALNDNYQAVGFQPKSAGHRATLWDAP